MQTKTKNTILIGGMVVIISLVAIVLLQLNQKDGKEVVVYINGEETARYELATNQSIQLEPHALESNSLVIQNGECFIESSNCNNQICVETGKISKTGERIVCLPHRLSIQIEGGKAVEVDAIAQ